MLAYAWGYGFFPEIGKVAWAVSFLYLICGALRLARFNVQASKPALQKPHASPKVDKKAFVGLPIPAGASLLAAIVHFWPMPLRETTTRLGLFGGYTISPREWAVLLLVLVTCLSLLMVSTIRHTSFQTINPRQRNPRLVILVIGLLLSAVWLYSQYTLLALATLYATHGVLGKIGGLFRRHGHAQAHADAAAD
jgi:CDP-diacylglycerol--serine O-phosphatidyltransferase